MLSLYCFAAQQLRHAYTAHKLHFIRALCSNPRADSALSAFFPLGYQSLAGRFYKKYLGYEHSETGYRRIFLIPIWRILIPASQRAKKKKVKKLFSSYKIIDPENFIKVSQNPNKVARDTQGLPTVPHNDFGGLNFKDLASEYLLLMATSPYKITFSKNKS